MGTADNFTIKDSGARQEFASGMVRDTTEGKIDFLNPRFGPMFKRWAAHLTKGRQKYPDPAPGMPNWMLAAGEEEYQRARASAARHFEQWLDGDADEDHAAAVYFNINLAEYVRERVERETDAVLEFMAEQAEKFADETGAMSRVSRPWTPDGPMPDEGDVTVCQCVAYDEQVKP